MTENKTDLSQLDREALENLALLTVSSYNYYELTDCRDYIENSLLIDIINCQGDAAKEDQLISTWIGF